MREGGGFFVCRSFAASATRGQVFFFWLEVDHETRWRWLAGQWAGKMGLDWLGRSGSRGKRMGVEGVVR